MMNKMKAPMQPPKMRTRSVKPAKPAMAGMPDFAERAQRPGGMKKGGAVKKYASGGCVSGKGKMR